MARLPRSVIPAEARVSGILNDSENLAIVLVSTWVYPTLVRFDLELFRRPTPDTLDLMMGVNGFGRPLPSERTSDPFQLAFEWSDGSVSSNLPQISLRGGLGQLTAAGDGEHMSVPLVLDHLPPAGEFSVYTAWPYFGLDERKVTFDADRIAESAGYAVTLWPESPPRTEFPSLDQRAPRPDPVRTAGPPESWLEQLMANAPEPLMPPRESRGHEFRLSEGRD